MLSCFISSVMDILQAGLHFVIRFFQRRHHAVFGLKTPLFAQKVYLGFTLSHFGPVIPYMYDTTPEIGRMTSIFWNNWLP